MNDATWRALRTLAQGLTGAGVWGFIELYVLPLIPVENRPVLSMEQRAMAITIMGALVSALHNWLENHVSGFPTIGKVPVVTDSSNAIGLPADARPTFPPTR
jgi:hypothetical protein